MSIRDRETYRHGDLQRVLVNAGVALAREGGPAAVTLREVTRRAGVVPNAAYRHFASRDDLMLAVRKVALNLLAQAIQRDLDALDRNDMKRKAFARASLRTVGLAYLAFAATEPGLFRAAFANAGDQGVDVEVPTRTGDRLNPFELLGVALDRMVEAGLLTAERRPGAEFLAWSAVHGLAMLLGDGPLRHLDPAQREDAGLKLCAMVERGL